MDDVDRLYVEIEKWLMKLVGFFFIRGIDCPYNIKIHEGSIFLFIAGQSIPKDAWTIPKKMLEILMDWLPSNGQDISLMYSE